MTVEYGIYDGAVLPAYAITITYNSSSNAMRLPLAPVWKSSKQPRNISKKVQNNDYILTLLCCYNTGSQTSGMRTSYKLLYATIQLGPPGVCNNTKPFDTNAQLLEWRGVKERNMTRRNIVMDVWNEDKLATSPWCNSTAYNWGLQWQWGIHMQENPIESSIRPWQRWTIASHKTQRERVTDVWNWNDKKLELKQLCISEMS